MLLDYIYYRYLQTREKKESILDYSLFLVYTYYILKRYQLTVKLKISLFLSIFLTLLVII